MRPMEVQERGEGVGYMRPDPNDLVSPIGQEGLDRLIVAVRAFERAAYRRADVSGEIGEQIVARLLGAWLRRAQHAPDWDAWSEDLERISIRTRQEKLDGSPRRVVDLAGDYDAFAFCYLDGEYQPYIVQLLGRAEAHAVRDRYRKNVGIPVVLALGKRLVGEGRPWPPPRRSNTCR